MTKIINKISAGFALGCLILTGFQSVATQAQATPPAEYYNALLNITPDITTAPLFKSTTPISIALTGYQSTADMTPVTGAYTCTFQARAMQDRNSTTNTWATVAGSVPYNPTTGCNAELTKTLRGNGLNWSIRVTVTSVTDASITHSFYSEYAFSFQGAGVAVGN